MKENNKNPQVTEVNYGNVAYRRLSAIPGYSEEALNITFFYIKMKDYYGKDRPGYIRCTKKQAYDYRNLERNTEREDNSYNEHIWNNSESFTKEIEDADGEITVVEYEDRTALSPSDYSYIEETKAKAMSFAKDEIDLKIIQCLLNGLTKDGEIADAIHLSRSSTQERRFKLQKRINEGMQDYKTGLKEQEARRTCTYGKNRN